MKSLLYYLLMALILVMVFTRCSRKLHTERTETNTEDTSKRTIDSLSQVTKTLSDAYESLLQSQTSTEVTVNEGTPPAGMPHILSEVTVHPDGSKTIKGGTIVYRDNALTTQRLSAMRLWVIDSMNRVVKADTSHHAESTVATVRTVKSTFIPVWIWIILGIAGLLWLNERFGIVKIPLLTKL